MTPVEWQQASVLCLQITETWQNSHSSHAFVWMSRLVALIGWIRYLPVSTLCVSNFCCLPVSTLCAGIFCCLPVNSISCLPMPTLCVSICCCLTVSTLCVSIFCCLPESTLCVDIFCCLPVSTLYVSIFCCLPVSTLCASIFCCLPVSTLCVFSVACQCLLFVYFQLPACVYSLCIFCCLPVSTLCVFSVAYLCLLFVSVSDGLRMGRVTIILNGLWIFWEKNDLPFWRPWKSVKNKELTEVFESLWLLTAPIRLTSQWWPDWLTLRITSFILWLFIRILL